MTGRDHPGLTAGLCAALDEAGRAFASEIVRRHLRADMVERADWHRTQRHTLVIVSASLGAYLRPLADRLEIDDALAVELVADAAGTLPPVVYIDPAFGLNDDHPPAHPILGQELISAVYTALARSPQWKNVLLVITYDEHGGYYDHVPPPDVVTDGFVAQPAATGTGEPFYFDRLGVRVPAVLVSPWVPKGTVVNGRIFEHASIPATATDWLLGLYSDRSPREKNAETFLDLLMAPDPRLDCIEFRL